MRRKLKAIPNEPAEKHDDVIRKLDEHERKLHDFARRLRNLEHEAGIFKPPLKGVEIK